MPENRIKDWEPKDGGGDRRNKRSKGEQAEEFWRSQGDFEVILVDEAGEIYLTEGLEDCFECGENLHMTILKRKKS